MSQTSLESASNAIAPSMMSGPGLSHGSNNNSLEGLQKTSMSAANIGTTMISNSI